MRSLDRARAILEPLAAANPLAARYQSNLADCYSEIASVQARRQESGETLLLLEKARAIEEGLIDRYPDQPAYRKSLAEMTNVLGYAYYKLGNNDEALKSFRQVQDICNTVSKQVTVGPKPLWLLNLMALSHSNIGWIHKEKGELQDAIKSLERALEYRTTLVDSHPSVTAYKMNLGTSCREIALFQHEDHRDAEAFQSIRRSVDVLKVLVRAQPDQAGYHSELGLSWNYLGVLYDEARENTEALAAFEQAVAEQQVAVDKASGFDGYRGFLANHLDNLGEIYADLGQVDRGLPYYSRAIQIRQHLLATHPENRFYLLDLARALSTLGDIQRHAGDSTAARGRSPRRGASWNGARPRRPAMNRSRCRSARHSSERRAYSPTCESRRRHTPCSTARRRPCRTPRSRQPKRLGVASGGARGSGRSPGSIAPRTTRRRPIGSMPVAWPCGKIGQPASWPPWLSRRRLGLP